VPAGHVLVGLATFLVFGTLGVVMGRSAFGDRRDAKRYNDRRSYAFAVQTILPTLLCVVVAFGGSAYVFV
jgi:hypothetical protein